MIRLEFSARDLVNAPREVSAAHVRAGRRAVRRTLQWVRTQGLRRIAQAEKVPVGALRRGRRSAIRVGAAQTKLDGFAWFGILPIKAGYLGKARQLKAGAKVRGRLFEGAFLATMPNGNQGVFKRTGRQRLPITAQYAALDKAEAAVTSLRPLVPARLRTVYVQELNYQLTRLGRA